VNKSVAEKAISVHADELIRKPFQPQELVSRVRALIHPKPAETSEAEERRLGSKPLSSIFAPPPPSAPPEYAWPRALAEALTPRPAAQPPMPQRPVAPGPTRPSAGSAAELQKLRNEIMRLELLVKKLQTELSIEKQYCASLELHIRTLQEVK
jgi:hypothetical protein